MMNYAALMLGAFGLVAIVTIYYTFARKPATKPEHQAEPARQA
jgi:hypothetical protein